VTCSDVNRDTGSSDLGISSKSSVPANQGKEVSQLDQDCFLPNSFKFMLHQSSYQRRYKIWEKYLRSKGSGFGGEGEKKISKNKKSVSRTGSVSVARSRD
jgi:hypothetical protein